MLRVMTNWRKILGYRTEPEKRRIRILRQCIYAAFDVEPGTIGYVGRENAFTYEVYEFVGKPSFKTLYPESSSIGWVVSKDKSELI
jgi:hypothetical protein